MRTFFLFLALVATLLSCLTQAFVMTPLQSRANKADSSLQMTILTYGNKKMNFKPGTPMKSAVAKLGIKPKYSCNK